VDVADLLHELGGRAAERVDGPRHLRKSEAGVRGGRSDVGRQQQFHAATGAIAVDGGDDRLREHLVLEQRVTNHPGRLRRRTEIAAQVRAGAKGPVAGAGEDDAAAGAALQLVPQPRQIRHHLP
jgi:hypothetical protein